MSIAYNLRVYIRVSTIGLQYSLIAYIGRGIILMANAGKNTNWLEFFICTETTPWLHGKHAVFGKVVDGLRVVKEMEKVRSDEGQTSSPEDCDQVKEN